MNKDKLFFSYLLMMLFDGDDDDVDGWRTMDTDQTRANI
jgi:hypothetical protein